MWRLDLPTSVWTPLVASSLSSVASIGNTTTTTTTTSGNGAAQASQPEAAAAEGQSGAPPAAGAGGLVPLAGHSVTAWGDRLLLLGGHVKVRA